MKKYNTHKFLSLLIAFTMVFNMLPVGVLAAGTDPVPADVSPTTFTGTVGEDLLISYTWPADVDSFDVKNKADDSVVASGDKSGYSKGPVFKETTAGTKTYYLHLHYVTAEKWADTNTFTVDWQMPKFDVTVTGGTANPSKAAEGSTVTLSPTAVPAGLVFDKWEVLEGEAAIDGNTLTMPANAVKVRALYKMADVENITATTGEDVLITWPEGATDFKVYEGSSTTVVSSGDKKGYPDKIKIDKQDTPCTKTYRITINHTATNDYWPESNEFTVTWSNAAHSVNVTGGTATPASAAAGTEITLEATNIPKGLALDKWEATPDTLVITGSTFTMPNENVEVKAVYKMADIADIETTVGEDVIIPWPDGATDFEVYEGDGTAKVGEGTFDGYRDGIFIGKQDASCTKTYYIEIHHGSSWIKSNKFNVTWKEAVSLTSASAEFELLTYGSCVKDVKLLSAEPEKYTAEIISFRETKSSDPLGQDIVLVGSQYYIKIRFTAKAGYKFAPNAKYSVKGNDGPQEFNTAEIDAQFRVESEANPFTITVTNGEAYDFTNNVVSKATPAYELRLDGINPDSANKVFQEWKVIKPIGLVLTNSHLEKGAKFRMPGNNVEVEAVYADKSSLNVIENVKLDGNYTPVTGAKPLDIKVPADANYIVVPELKGGVWETNNKIITEPDYTFKADEKYKLRVAYYPKPGYIFSDETKAPTLPGATIVKEFNPTERKIIARYDFLFPRENPAGTLTGTVSIAGTVNVGETLTASVSGCNSKLSDLNYRWVYQGSDSTVYSGKTYTIRESDRGKVLVCKVTSNDTAYPGTIEASTTAVPAADKGIVLNELSATITEPKDGENPSYTASVTSSLYTAKVTKWTDTETNNVLESTDTFASGKKYKAEIEFTATGKNAISYNGVKGADAKINGKSGSLDTISGPLNPGYSVARYIVEFTVASSSIPSVPNSTLLYGYNKLPSDDLKNAYAIILDGMTKKEASIDISAQNISVEQLKKLITTIRNDNPQLYFLDKGYSHISGTTVTTVNPKYLSTSFDKASYESAVTELLKAAKGKTTEYDKALALHDALVKHVVYDTSATNQFNAYGALVDKKAVCEGYAKAYQELLRREGIVSYIVTGTSKGENHAWNLVKLDGKYYHVDVTWDDPYEKDPEKDKAKPVYHPYFAVSTATIKVDHTIGTNEITLDNAPDNKLHPDLVEIAKPTVDNIAAAFKPVGNKAVARIYFTGTFEEMNTFLTEANINAIVKKSPVAPASSTAVPIESCGREWRISYDARDTLPEPVVLNTIKVTAPTEDLTVPEAAIDGTANEKSFTFTVKGTYSDGTTNTNVNDYTWSLVEPVPLGVTLVSNEVKVNSRSSSGPVTVKASKDGKEATASITLTKDDTSVTARVVVTGPESVLIPKEGHMLSTADYTATAYNKYGEKIVDKTITWSEVTTQGTSIVSNGSENGKRLTVNNTAVNNSTVVMKATENGVSGEVTVTLKAKNDISSQIGFTADEFFVYDGTAKGIETTFTDEGYDINTKYEGTLHNGTSYDSSDKPTEAGDYKIVVTVENAENFGTNYVTFTIEPKPVTPSAGGVITIADAGKYDGTDKKPSVTVTVNGTELSSSDFDVAYEENKNAGDTAKATATGKGNYTGEISDTFSIGTAEALAAAPTGLHKTYDGTNAFTGEIKYTIKGIGTEKTTMTLKASEIAGSDVGNHKVTAIDMSFTPVFNNENGFINNNYSLNSIPDAMVEVEAKPITAVSINGISSPYTFNAEGQDFTAITVTSSDIAATDNAADILGFDFYKGEEKLTSAPLDAGDYKVKVYLKTTATNYTYEGADEAALKIKNATLTPSTVTKTVKYNDTNEIAVPVSAFAGDIEGTLSTLTNGDDTKVTASLAADNKSIKLNLASGLTETSTGDVTLTALFTPTKNYDPVTVTLKVTITDKSDASLTVSMENRTYGDEAKSPVPAVTVPSEPDLTKVTYTYTGTKADGNTWTEADTLPDVPGTYKVTAHYEDDGYVGSSEAFEFTIAKADLTYDITGLTVETKVFNNTDKAKVKGTLALTGKVTGDSLTAPSDITAKFSDAKVGNNKDVTAVIASRVTGSDAWKYNIPAENYEVSLKGNITKPVSSAIMGDFDDGKTHEVDEVNLADMLSDPLYSNINTAYPDGVNAIKSALAVIAKQDIPNIGANCILYDIQYKVDGVYTPDTPVSFTLPYPEGTDKNTTFSVIHMNLDAEISNITSSVTRGDYGLYFNNVTTSPFLVSWKVAAPPRPSSSGGSHHSYIKEENEFWETVKDAIEEADKGDTIKVNAKSYDRMTWEVMHQLKKHADVSLVIDWDGGSRITIPAGKTLPIEPGRVYYPLAFLEKAYKEMALKEENKDIFTNPETGFYPVVINANIPAPSADIPTLTPSVTPIDDGINTEAAIIEAEPITKPVIEPVEEIVEETVKKSNLGAYTAFLVAGIALMVAIVVLIKRRREDD